MDWKSELSSRIFIDCHSKFRRVVSYARYVGSAFRLIRGTFEADQALLIVQKVSIELSYCSGKLNPLLLPSANWIQRSLSKTFYISLSASHIPLYASDRYRYVFIYNS